MCVTVFSMTNGIPTCGSSSPGPCSQGLNSGERGGTKNTQFRPPTTVTLLLPTIVIRLEYDVWLICFNCYSAIYIFK